MTLVLFFLISLVTSTAGAGCGIGGGIIIKPALDAIGILSAAEVNFLSGLTVLAMSVISIYKHYRHNRRQKNSSRRLIFIAAGAVLGGIAGNQGFDYLYRSSLNKDALSGLQAVILAFVTLGSLIYILLQRHVSTKKLERRLAVFMIGFLLGLMSAFLGIGGGPVNLVVLSYFFSAPAKEAAVSSLYIIMFSQLAGLASYLVKGTIPAISPGYLIVMIIGGIIGGLAGRLINQKATEKQTGKLLIALLLFILGINIFNICKFI